MNIKKEINKKSTAKTVPKKKDKIDHVHDNLGNEIPKGTKMVLVKKYKHVYETEDCIMKQDKIVYEYVEADLGDMLCDIVYFENSKVTPRIAHHFKII